MGAITPMVRVPTVTTGAGTAVVAAPLAGPRLAAAVWRAWDRGDAILPLDPGAPASELRRLLARLRPTHLDDGGGPVPVSPAGWGAPPAPAAPGTAAVVVTSGTTGTPKGVELTRAGMEAMGRAYSEGVGAGPGDRWLACLPLHHVASLAVLARSYVTGVPHAVHEGFDVERVGRAPRDEGATIVSVVPTALRRLLDAEVPLHEYRLVIVGGAPCPPALRARAERAGVTVVDAYGMTETWGGFALDGVPVAGAQVRVAQDGELLVRGPMVMRGYRLDDAQTAAVLDRDGWLHTGDVGTYDGRTVRVVDRKKDIVISGGVNVSPTEVEAVLSGHPALDDVCVVGVPDERWGERVVAYVVSARPPTVEDLRAFARERLSAPKLPREVRVVDAIPRSPGGKPLRRLLRGG
ncbi:MAG: hypothetical protein KatS3mg009_3244 [Acidimicrobiia bacterium]|nr:MAG: hypothetical protein KatS3mg009_3244 [Acidimicrobiia bacterium]